ncbi:hypothetical protein BLL42_02150 [Pseudomonas frederiksbergensis]|uniref:DUF4760 domain-containing protein n=1 Tax=Pseudomonas frederiksbergensis TaxID=104087 RepID=A0A1J0EFC0_9PSED|nr:hypothetical protein [Pseudomonas frederiksbergensis]APC14592.1 hypothetical protein BLL42_02150 [Pseudomonas frederiksbergensis]
MWGSDELWAWLNQFGIICTIVGFALAVVTFVYVRKVRVLLVSKSRLPAVYGDITRLMPEVRAGLKTWEDSKEDVIHKLYEVRGHIQNIRPSLGSKEKALADVLISLLAYERKWYSSKVSEMSRDDGWYISRRMTEFEVMLNGLDKDNEAARI